MCQISDDVLHKNQRLESDQYNSVGCCPANYLWVWQDPHPGSHLPGSFKIAPKAKRSRFGLSGVVEGQLGQCGERQAGHLDGLLCCPLNPTLPPQPTKLKLEKKRNLKLQSFTSIQFIIEEKHLHFVIGLILILIIVCELWRGQITVPNFESSCQCKQQRKTWLVQIPPGTQWRLILFCAARFISICHHCQNVFRGAANWRDLLPPSGEVAWFLFSTQHYC